MFIAANLAFDTKVLLNLMARFIDNGFFKEIYKSFVPFNLFLFYNLHYQCNDFLFVSIYQKSSKQMQTG